MNILKKEMFEKIVSSVLNLKYLKYPIITIWYILGISVSYYFSYVLRFDFDFDKRYYIIIGETLPVLIIISLITFKLFGLYKGLWRYVSIKDAPKIILSVFTSTVIFAIIIYFMRNQFQGFPRSIFFNYFLLQLAWIAFGRMIARYLRECADISFFSFTKGYKDESKQILLLGNLNYIDLFLRSTRGLNVEGLGYIAGIITDDKSATSSKMHGVLVLGNNEKIVDSIKSLNISVVLCLPPYTEKQNLNEIIKIVEKNNIKCDFRMIPSAVELATGNLEISKIRKVEIEDLLGRPPITLNNEYVTKFINNKNIMVTGAGGSIGSELCRQLVKYNIKRLVIFEQSEVALFNINNELIALNKNIEIIPVAGDVRKYHYLLNSIKKNDIEIIYHAAAYKHVPLMEQNPAACFETNIIGANNIAKIAELTQIKKIILVSTDKAVRPTSIMGATKRVAEKILIEKSNSKCTAVRFGNVLGSSGSVIPFFKKQIENGGPVTVTTPNMTRFFMTIPEAVSLVLEAGSVGQFGQIMVLDMGESVKIYDLAKNLIELSGFTPEEDIKIEFTGMRPGEKEYEELLTNDEDVIETEYDKIYCMEKKDNMIPSNIDIEKVEQAIITNDEDNLKSILKEIIPENLLEK